MNCVSKHSRDHADQNMYHVCRGERKGAEFISNKHTSTQLYTLVETWLKAQH